VALGYWVRHGGTLQVFRAHLGGAYEGSFLRAGDGRFVRDGELFITGRLKDPIIIRGHNLYLQDIEAADERVVPFDTNRGQCNIKTLIRR
jgi:acyl-CoA synthetase (AMP-forming)/AMP-acid ligase II